MGHRNKLQQLGKVNTKANLLFLKNRIKSFGKSVEHNNVRRKLKEKDRLPERTEQFFNVGRWTYNFADKTMNWSPETYKLFECPEEHHGTLLAFFDSCIDKTKYVTQSELPNYFKQDGEDSITHYPVTTPSGNKKLISFSSTPIYNKLGGITAVEGFVMDQTEKILGDRGLDNFFNLSHDLHCIVHMNGYFLKVSPTWIDFLGFSEKELLSQTFLEFLHPEDIKPTLSIMEKIVDHGSTTRFENRYITKSGEIVYLRWNVRVDPETKLAYCNAVDITESRLATEKMQTELSSKDLLLREIHHRVKNNLQIISSILSLQSRINSSEIYLRRLYEDSQNRIQSMASIHEMFYQSKALDKIEFGAYLNKLIGDLSRSLTTETNSISFTLDADEVFVNLNLAIPLGLLMNELVTNSIKHGEDKDGNVKINISVELGEADEIHLFVGDKGINTTENILCEDDENESLGIMLINSLVDQIDGTITQLENCEGTVFKLTFDNKQII